MNTRIKLTLRVSKYFLSTFILLCAITLNGQSNYDFYYPGVQYFYLNGDKHINEYSPKYVGMKIENSPCNDLYLTTTEKTPPGSWPRPYSIPSFSGLELCQYQDSIVMNVGKNFPVIIRKNLPLGSKWLVTTEEGKEVLGSIDSVRYEAVGTTFDTVKYINFYHADTVLQEQPIRLSRSNGLLTGAYFWDLIEEKETVALISDDELPLPLIATDFAYKIGDEFHIEEVKTLHTEHIDSHLYSITQKILTVVSVGEQNGDEIPIEYDISTLKYLTTGYFDIGIAYDSVYTTGEIDTIIEQIPAWTKAQPGAFMEIQEWLFFISSTVRVVEHCGKSLMLQDQIFSTKRVYRYLSELNDNRYKQMSLLGYGGNYFEWFGLMELSAEVKELQHVSLANGATCFGQPFDFNGLVSQTNRERPSIKIRVFPNPVNDKFRINTDDHSELEATIFNAKGHALKQVRIRSGAEVDIADLPTGLYFLNVKSSSGVRVMRLIKN